MHRYNDVALAALLMLMPVEATSLLGEPFSKCRAFHCRAPNDRARLLPTGSLPYGDFGRCLLIWVKHISCGDFEITLVRPTNIYPGALGADIGYGL
jgi:hypothetical protein